MGLKQIKNRIKKNMCAMCVRAFACMYFVYMQLLPNLHALHAFQKSDFTFCDDIQIALTLLSLLIFKAGKRIVLLPRDHAGQVDRAHR